MKKSFLVLAAALSLGLAACGNKPDTPVGPVTPELPTEAGKITFWFEMADNEAAIAIPDYCDVFLTGAFFGKTDWPTKAEEVVTMKKLAEDSNVYYGQWEGDYTTIEDKGFQLTIGYAADSGAPSTGVNWSYKSEECKAGSGESGMDNLQFTLSSDGLTAALGEHHWEDAPAPVVIVENVKLKLTLATAAPAWVTLFAPGNYRNNWACDPAKDAMTPNADRTVWTIDIESINLGTYEMKVIAEYTGGSWGWKNTVLDDGANNNFSLMILRANGGATIDLNERAEVEGGIVVDWTKLPDPETIPNVAVTFKVEFGAALDTAKYPDWYVIGSNNGWKVEDAYKFVVAEDKLSMTATFEVGHMVSYEFGICANSSWNPCLKVLKGEEKGNFSLEVPAEATTYTFTVSAEIMALLNADGGEHGIAAPAAAKTAA